MSFGRDIPWKTVKPDELRSLSASALNALAEREERGRRGLPLAEGLAGLFGAVAGRGPGVDAAWVKILDAVPNSDGLYRGQLTERDAARTTREWTDPDDGSGDPQPIDQVWVELPDEVDTYDGTPARQTLTIREGHRYLCLWSGSFESGGTLRLLYTAAAGRLGYFIGKVTGSTGPDDGRYTYQFDEQTKSAAGFTWTDKTDGRTGDTLNLAEVNASEEEPAVAIPADSLVRVTEVLLADGTVEFWCEAYLTSVGMRFAGEIVMAGFGTPPTGWLVCDGQQYDQLDYPDLYAAIGDAFGSADAGMFFVPDLRGRHPTGATLAGHDDPEGNPPPDVGAVDIGELYGVPSEALNHAGTAVADHDNHCTTIPSGACFVGAAVTVDNDNLGSTVTVPNNNHAHEYQPDAHVVTQPNAHTVRHRPPAAVVNFLIKT